MLLGEIIRRFQVQSLVLNPCTWSWLIEIEQSTPVVDKGFSSRFGMDSRIAQETPEEDRGMYRSKHCDYNAKDDVSSPNILRNNE